MAFSDLEKPKHKNFLEKITLTRATTLSKNPLEPTYVRRDRSVHVRQPQKIT